MPADNQLELVVEVDVNKANASIRGATTDLQAQQVPVHSSSSSSRTRSVEIAGKSSGASNTGRPLSFLVPSR
jgi:hypothetical protein